MINYLMYVHINWDTNEYISYLLVLQHELFIVLIINILDTGLLVIGKRNLTNCWSITVPSDRDLLGSMMARLAQVEQQLKNAQAQLLEKVIPVIC